MSDIRITITRAGRAALVNAQHTGTAARRIMSIGVTAQAFTPNPGMTTLPGEIKRLTTIGGEVVDAATLHVTLQDMSQDRYTLRGFALYLDDGTLFALHGGAGTIMEKSAQATLMLAADIHLADLGTTALHIGPANFTNPPASETVAGVVRFATTAETAAGYADDRAVSPANLKAETQKLALSSHTHGISQISGLQTELDRKVVKIQTVDDISQRLDSGYYQCTQPGPGWPAGAQGRWHLLSVTHSNPSNYFALQLASSFGWRDAEYYIRCTSNNGTVSWDRLWHSRNFNPASKADTNHGHGIGQINGLTDALAGKAAASHAHTWAEITGKPATALRWPSWPEVTGKPQTFPPQPHVHAAGDITSGVLASARIPKLPISHINGLEGELANRMMCRDSINGYLPTNANTLGITAGAMVQNGQNNPSSDWTQMFSNIADRFGWQLAAPWHEANLYVRSKVANTWRPWRKLWDSVNFDPASKLNASQFHWQHLPGKPQTFPAASHRHGQSDIDGLPEALASKVSKITDAPSLANRIDSGFYQASQPGAGWPAGAQGWWHALSVTHSTRSNYYALQFASSFWGGGADLHVRTTSNNGNAPWLKVWNSGNFDPASKANANHGHGIGQINGLTDALAGKAAASHSHTWNEITGKPATALRWPSWTEVTGKPQKFPAASHTHAMSDIAGLAAALDPGHQHAETGWAKLPGGLILQWGIYRPPANSMPPPGNGDGGIINILQGSTGGSNNQERLQPKIHFAIPFPQACFVVTTTDLNPPGTHDGDPYSQLHSHDVNGFVLYTQQPHNQAHLNNWRGCTWIAIGC